MISRFVKNSPLQSYMTDMRLYQSQPYLSLFFVQDIHWRTLNRRCLPTLALKRVIAKVQREISPRASITKSILKVLFYFSQDETGAKTCCLQLKTGLTLNWVLLPGGSRWTVQAGRSRLADFYCWNRSKACSPTDTAVGWVHVLTGEVDLAYKISMQQVKYCDKYMQQHQALEGHQQPMFSQDSRAFTCWDILTVLSISKKCKLTLGT